MEWRGPGPLVPPLRLPLPPFAASKSLSHWQQMGWLVGAVGIKARTRTWLTQAVAHKHGLHLVSLAGRRHCSQNGFQTQKICFGQGQLVQSEDSADSESPEDFLSLFSPIERHVTQQFFNRQVGPMFAH